MVALEADGSALYTMQSWWTMAREGLDVTTILFNNQSYAVLNMELDRVGVGTPGPRARDMLDLARPDLDFVSLARGMGLHASGPIPPRGSAMSWGAPWPLPGRAWWRRSFLA